MKRRRVDSKVEKAIVIGLIVSKEFLSRSYNALEVELFTAAHFRQIVKWCKMYFDRYSDAPGKRIENIYHFWVEKNKPEDELVESVRVLLEEMSARYAEGDELNVNYLIDSLGEFLKNQRLSRLKDSLEGLLARGDSVAAETAVTGYSSPSVGQGTGVDPFNQLDVWDDAYAESAAPLIRFQSKASNLFFNESLARDCLVAIMGPEKRGKTWWCIEFVMRALMSRRRVAFFEVGDMSQSQVLKRIGTRLTKRPQFERDLGRIQVPTGISRTEGDGENGVNVSLTYDIITADRIANPSACKKAALRFMRRCGISKDIPFLMTSVHPNSSINVKGIEGILGRWERENGFIPDVIVIDYPDILCPEPGSSRDTRDQINETWKALRRLSQERHALVIAPTQANRQSYNADQLEMEHSSEDKRKLSHVTGMVGLNQSVDEKRAGVMRLNWIVLREANFTADRFLYVGQCLSLGRPFCCSTL